MYFGAHLLGSVKASVPPEKNKDEAKSIRFIIWQKYEWNSFGDTNWQLNIAPHLSNAGTFMLAIKIIIITIMKLLLKGCVYKGWFLTIASIQYLHTR